MNKMVKTTGLVDGNKCAVCGVNVEEVPPRFMFHGDGEHTFSFGFLCTECGNTIVQEYERDDDDLFDGWYGEQEEDG